MLQKAIFASEDTSVPQYRMRRLQVFNWGTFSGLHDIPIAEEGFLFLGRSGSGKSTLLDALSALLVPPLWLSFNAAAREGDKGRHDRNLVSYIRGAWADQKDTDSGEIATQYLRVGTTWSAIDLEYASPSGQVVNLAQLFWLKGSASGSTDVRRHFMIAERPFEIALELKDFDLDIRSLKQRLEDVYHFENFRPYSERFRNLLSIESEMALKLLHKTQSAKNLGDLNTFLREFMLDRPPTFEVAQRLVEEFAELDAAHQAVVVARKQVETLRPARDSYDRLKAVDLRLIDLAGLLAGVDAYRDQCKAGLLEEEINRLKIEDQGLEGRERQQQETFENHRQQLTLLEEQHRQQGGTRIEELERQKKDSERQRNDRLAKRGQAETACKQLGWVLPESPQGFAELAARARDAVEGWKEESDRAEQQRDGLRDAKRKVEEEFAAARREIEAMQRQPSNIFAPMVELRRQLTAALGLAEMDLPFAGELIEVKEEESGWRGAIERVLRGFALSLLVDDGHYAAVSSYVNDTRLNNRLSYHRIPRETEVQPRAIQASSLVHKLRIKDSSYRAWLEADLKRRFDYACVDNMRDFRQSERALTREGQVRHGKSHHEKNDSRAIDNRREWVLGFDNRAKLRLYQEHAQGLGAEISRLDGELNRLSEEKEKQRKRFEASLILANLQWQEIDVAGLLDRIQTVEKALDELRSGNPVLKALGERIGQQKTRVAEAENAVRETQVKRGKISDLVKDYRQELEELACQIQDVVLTKEQQQALKLHFEADKPLTLKNLEPQRTRVERALTSEQKTLEDERNQLIRAVEERFAEFKREWPQEGANLVDATVASASEFIALLQRLEHDGLPKHEQRFFDMLKDQSTENLAALNTHLTQARKEISERMELVNESLAEVEFNPGTRLQIEVNERYLPDVKVFREQIKQVLEHAWLMERQEAEARFQILRDLVGKLGGSDTEQERWREQVLDVRLHVEFIGREYGADGREVEVYRSGAGKSGGQREKLTTTCLAAALRYQLGGSAGDPPIYAPVVLDEAFGKADTEFTELALKIFSHFGFQMIVATPLKSVMTLEPFIGGACFVDITDRKHSKTLLIEYDRQKRRLNLPEKVRGEGVPG